VLGENVAVSRRRGSHLEAQLGRARWDAEVEAQRLRSVVAELVVVYCPRMPQRVVDQEVAKAHRQLAGSIAAESLDEMVFRLVRSRLDGRFSGSSRQTA